MNATVSTTRKKNIAIEFLKKTAGHIVGATGEYISETMPNTGSIISDSKQILVDVQSSLGFTPGGLTKIKKLKNQITFKALLKWYMQKEDEFDYGDDSSNLS